MIEKKNAFDLLKSFPLVDEVEFVLGDELKMVASVKDCELFTVVLDEQTTVNSVKTKYSEFLTEQGAKKKRFLNDMSKCTEKAFKQMAREVLNL